MNKMSLSVREVGKIVLLMAGIAALAGCASIDDTTNSRLNQPATPDPEGAVDVGDIAIAGQTFAHAIIDLPQIASAPNPPLVQFAGVTSIINGPVDPTPYTELLRDRLLLVTREKLRFVERELPQLGSTSKKSKRKPADSSVIVSSDPDYQILAELRGNYEDDFYKIQIQLTDYRTGAVVLNALYRIRKEAQPQPDQTVPAAPGGVEDTSPQAPAGSTGIQ